MASITSTLLSQTSAEEILKPYLDTLSEIIDGGWDAWMQHYKHRHHILDSRARASIVYSEIRHLAEDKFADCPDARIVFKRGLFLLYIGEQIVLRFKKLDKKGRSKNYPTRQALLFEAQLSLPGLLPATRLNAGYHLDPLQQSIQASMISCQIRERIEWKLDIGGFGSQVTVVEMPAREAADKATTRRVRAKVVSKKEQTSE